MPVRKQETHLKFLAVKAYVIDALPEECYRWEMIEINLQTVEI